MGAVPPVFSMPSLRSIFKGPEKAAKRALRTEFPVNSDLFSASQFVTPITLTMLRDAYQQNPLVRRVNDVSVDTAFRNGFVQKVPRRSIDQLASLFKGVRLFGESAVLKDGKEWQVIYPRVQYGYTVRFDAHYKEVGLDVVPVGATTYVKVPYGDYIRVFSEKTDPDDPRGGMSVIRNVYWPALDYIRAVENTGMILRTQAGGFLFLDMSSYEFDSEAGDLSNIMELVSKYRILPARGLTPGEIKPPVWVDPTDKSYGVINFLDHLLGLIISESGLPKNLLFGDPQGRVATADSTLRWFFDSVRSYQALIIDTCREILGIEDLQFVDPAGVVVDDLAKVADVVVKLKDVLSDASIADILTKVCPTINWEVERHERSPGSPGPFGGGDPISSESPPGKPGPGKEGSDGIDF